MSLNVQNVLARSEAELAQLRIQLENQAVELARAATLRASLLEIIHSNDAARLRASALEHDLLLAIHRQQLFMHHLLLDAAAVITQLGDSPPSRP